ncbi:GDSL-like lipase/Acylhydrolase domain-containing protein [Sarocladium implicatum]|nr:GDSL-like lipase/Acylhydrolase domain-containing protein [Sarocladium implicatum]
MLPQAIAAVLLGASQALAVADYANGTRYLITFGDSYSQTGFDINGAKPSAENPLGNPPLPGWTASGGLDWPGFLVTEFNKSLTLAYNFAYGGATVDADLIAPYQDTVKSLIDQVEEFSSSIAEHPDYAPWTSQNSLFGIWMGVNDVGNSFWLENVADILEAVIAQYVKQLQIMYDAGARQFAILTVPPTDKTPTFLESDEWSREHLQSTIALFNDLVAAGVDDFASANEGAVVQIIDTSLPFNTAIANPDEYGAEDSTCFNNDGVSCLWFDNYHPGVAIQRLVAESVANTWPAFFLS